jgi:hypothetical protein
VRPKRSDPDVEVRSHLSSPKPYGREALYLYRTSSVPFLAPLRLFLFPHADASLLIGCVECDKSFTRSDALAKHMRIQHDINPIEPGRNKVSLAANARREATGAPGGRPVKKDSKRAEQAEEEWVKMVDTIDGEKKRKGKEREEAAARAKKKPGPPKGWKELKRLREENGGVDPNTGEESGLDVASGPGSAGGSKKKGGKGAKKGEEGDSDSDDSFTGPFMPPRVNPNDPSSLSAAAASSSYPYHHPPQEPPHFDPSQFDPNDPMLQQYQLQHHLEVQQYEQQQFMYQQYLQQQAEGSSSQHQPHLPPSGILRPRALSRYLIAKAKHRQAMEERDELEGELYRLKRELAGAWERKERALDAVLERELGFVYLSPLLLHSFIWSLSPEDNRWLMSFLVLPFSSPAHQPRS